MFGNLQKLVSCARWHHVFHKTWLQSEQFIIKQVLFSKHTKNNLRTDINIFFPTSILQTQNAANGPECTLARTY